MRPGYHTNDSIHGNENGSKTRTEVRGNPWKSEVYGVYHRIFTDLEEKTIADLIADNYLVHGRLLTDAFSSKS
jgi:hypothetical protein